VLPSDAWKPDGTGDPSGAILAMLLANVALPFFALAATGPLVATWFARPLSHAIPYPLYAVSNLGSLVALLAYPFGLEPRLALSTTGTAWSAFFVATGAAVVACAALARARRAPTPSPSTTPTDATPVRSDLTVHGTALWVLLSGVAVVLLMGVTNYLCLDVASIPSLWILPLAIYLITLIVCFGAPQLYWRLPLLASRRSPTARARS
jgi:hypothetical protein